MSNVCRAFWSGHEPEKVLVTDPAGKAIVSLPVTPGARRPSWEMLRDTEWCSYPGSTWEEASPADWSVAVFSFGRLEERKR